MIATNDLVPAAILGGPVVAFFIVIAVGNAVHEYPIRRRKRKRVQQ